MHKIFIANKRVEKRLNKYIKARKDIPAKLDRLKTNPRKELGAHALGRELAGKWACWLGSNRRMIYRIDDEGKKIRVSRIGTHKIYR